jgi:hypothetical protein
VNKLNTIFTLHEVQITAGRFAVGAVCVTLSSPALLLIRVVYWVSMLEVNDETSRYEPIFYNATDLCA